MTLSLPFKEREVEAGPFPASCRDRGGVAWIVSRLYPFIAYVYVGEVSVGYRIPSLLTFPRYMFPMVHHDGVLTEECKYHPTLYL